jgi:hypothetical protein
VTDVQQSHPALDRLVAYRLNRMAGDEAEAVRAHLADCASCRQMAEALQPDTLLALLQNSATPQPSGVDVATLAPSPSAVARTAAPPELADHSRYRLLEMLGAGGMGAVYKAEHRVMERLVALKVINPSLTKDTAAVERFHREVKTAARLSHPNIVTAFDAEHANDVHFLVMEYVEGASLDEVLAKRGPLPVAEACEYIRQAALGLQHAHERGMVHRDIKPQNLMLTRSHGAQAVGLVKVLDFGLARFVSESGPAGPLTQVGSVMGTPDYIAPEQAHDSRTADIRADIYSLGCTFYYLLAGQVPFPEGSALQKLMAHVDTPPRPIAEMRFDLPAGLAEVLDRMMAKDPAQRYQTPAEVAAALAPYAEGRVTAFEPVTVTALVADPVTVEPLPAEERRPQSRTGTIRNLAILSIVAGGLALSPVNCLACFFPNFAFPILGLVLAGAAWSMDPRRHERRLNLPMIAGLINVVAFFISLVR